ncbi:MAG: MoxR family ATPase [Myxococcales bacterium]|nr:MoxR family ATPase [Myxococcales bacterium]
MSQAAANASLPTPSHLQSCVQIRHRVIDEVRKVYVSSDTILEVLLVALLTCGHALLEGVPGIAKTTLVKAFALSLGCDFKRIQFTPDLLPADITGTYILNLQTNSFDLREGPIFAHVVLGDEINRAPAKTQSALLEAMQEQQVTIEGTTRELPRPFMVLATQNPIEQEGVYALPEAQVDRFLVKIRLGYPSPREERAILNTYNRTPLAVEPQLTPETIDELCEAVEGVHVKDELMDYIIRLVQATRTHTHVHLGASPRASLSLMRAAKSRAMLQGRDFVVPDDIKLLAPFVLTHRLILLPEAELEGVGAPDVIGQVLQDVRYHRDDA